MKKYCLIKEYPGSPKLGDYTYFCTKRQAWAIISRIDSNVIIYTIQVLKPEEYSEFWEEIVEKEYEILSKIGKFTQRIFTQKDFWQLREDQCFIHSVKRLSDGEVFTIGDKIVGTASIDENIKFGPGYTYIKAFNSNSFGTFDIEISTGVIQDYRPDKSTWKFLNIKKAKQPLFITEDGVKIFEGDNFYWVQKDNFDLRTLIPNWSFKVEYNRGWYFSTKKAAEEYILMNKPCLSINDVDESGLIKVDAQMKDLIKFVKSKL